MRVAALTPLVVASLLAGPARADQQWVANQLANGHRLTGLLQPLQLTEPFRLGDLPIGPCVVQVDASRVTSCLGVTDPFAIVSNTLTLKIDSTLHLTGGLLGVSGLGALTPSLPLAISGSNLVLNLDGTSVGVSGGNLQRVALTFAGAATGTMAAGSGSVTLAQGVGATTSVLGVSGSSAPRADIVASGDGQVFWDNAGTLGFAILPYSKLSGAPAALTFNPPLTLSGSAVSLGIDGTTVTLNGSNQLQVGALTGAIVKAAGATTTTFGAGGAMTALAGGG